MLFRKVKKGDLVTDEPPAYWDSPHIRPNWPHTNNVGKLVRTENIAGITYAVVRFKSSKYLRRISIDKLFVVAADAPRATI